MAESTLTLAQALSRAFSAYNGGKLVEAEQLCQQITNAKPDHFDAVHLLAVVQSNLGKKHLALASYDRALAVRPDYAEALFNRGVTLHELKRFEEALASYDRALTVRADYAEVLSNRGLALHELKRFEEALASYDRALTVRSDYAEALCNCGITLRELKRFKEALARFDGALTLRPDFAEALCNRGLALHELKRFEEALASYDRALTLRPDYAEVLFSRGSALHELKRFEEALVSYDRALTLRPDFAEALCNRGLTLHELKRYEEALASYDRALTLRPDYAEALCNRGFTLHALKRFNEATGICDDLLQRHPGLPGALALKGTIRAEVGDLDNAILFLENAIAGNARVANWHADLSGLYQTVYRGADAVRSGRMAVQLNPDSPQFLVNLAMASIDVGDRDQAIACLVRAIGVAPNDATAHLALAQMLLARGEMNAGWIEYEWRNDLDMARGTLPRFTSAQWNGMRLPGKVLLISDQGFGDAIQFARFIPSAAERCAEILLACTPELTSILSPISGVSTCLTRWEEVPGHSAHIRLSSLPYVLHTRLDEGVSAAGAYLKAPADRVEAWKRQLDSQLAPGKRVGFAWAGRPTHPNDRRRTLKLASLMPLLKQPNIRWVSLQTPIPAADTADFAACGALDLSAALIDFGETAAVIANLDLVITVDTAVAHLAGALGHPVWLMIPEPADWRWMLGRQDSPWYPSMRLFRQDVPGGWDKVVSEVGKALKGLRGTKRGKR
jgi:tetratricopeptide (TPR) repeat protein